MPDGARKHVSHDRLAAYLAGGLRPEKAARVEAHLGACSRCSEAADALRFGDTLPGLFSDVRTASTAVAERAVASFHRTTRTRVAPQVSRRILYVAAAIVFLAAFGAIGTNFDSGRWVQQNNADFASQSPNAAPAIGKTGNAEIKGPAGTPTGGMMGMGGGMMGMGGGMMGMTGGGAMGMGGVVGPQFDPIGRPDAPSVDTNALNPPGVDSNKPMTLSGLGSAPVITAPLNTTGQTSSSASASVNGSNFLGPYFAQPYYQGITSNSLASNNNPGGFGAALFGPGASSSGGGSIGNAGTGFQPGQFKPAPSVGASEPTQSAVKPSQSPPVTTTPTTPANDSVTMGQPPPAPSPEPTRRIVIRTGDIEFEVESFDSATATITKLITAIKGAFIATVNSEKLPTGKVKGTITVRVPPESLDGLVLDLRKELGKGGELKGVRLASQDVTKHYTDLESRLRGTRTMEQRLLQIIKEGKGEIKQLLEAEKELGLWRTRIEEFEGEIRYYANQAALSTLAIVLAEKEAKAVPTATESERVQAGVEVDDVDKAYQQLFTAVTDVKGRVTKSEVKQYAAGQFNATVNFEVAPEAAGPLRDRLRQLGRMARLEIDRNVQTKTAPDGSLPADAKLKRGDTLFLVQLYNLANIAPRETVTLAVAAADVAAAYQGLREALVKTTGRVVESSLNEQDRQNVTAQINFEVRRSDEAAVRAALEKAGEVIARQVARAPESDNVTDTKVMQRVTLLAATRVKPRESKVLKLAAPDVPTAYRILRDVVAKLPGRVVTAQLNEQDRDNVTGQLDFEVRTADVRAIEETLDSAGVVIGRQAQRAPESETASDSKVLYQLSFSATSKFKPRETTSLTIEVGDVDKAVAEFRDIVSSVKGRQLAGTSNREASGKTTAHLSFEVPLTEAANVVKQFKAVGSANVSQTTQDPQAPGDRFAIARLDVTLSNQEGIVPADEGLWTQVRRGLSWSVSALLKSVTWVVFGLCALLPWAVLGYAAYRIIRRTVTPPAEPLVATPASGPGA